MTTTIPTPESDLTERSPSCAICHCLEAFAQMRRARADDRRYAELASKWDPELALVEVSS